MQVFAPIRHDGFTLTSSSNPNEGPEAYIQISKTNSVIPVNGFFAIDGKINVMGITAESDHLFK